MGEWRVVGSHSLQFRMSLDRSVTDSEIHPHSLGHGFPPKVRRRAMTRKGDTLMEAWERDFEDVLALRCCLLYADFQSTLETQMRRRGCLWRQLMI